MNPIGTPTPTLSSDVVRSASKQLEAGALRLLDGAVEGPVSAVTAGTKTPPVTPVVAAPAWESTLHVIA
ncbi:MAG TPA: hypothetical protein VMK12_05605 [Anaeromyxobacteraceae bacterium]|nr:hypothetical protein [Anaeromyxobacteraceae bacterium]